MHRMWRECVRASAVILASASLALAPGLAAAQYQSGSDQSSASKQANQGSAQTSGSAAKTGQGAGEVGDRLHDSAKNFGEAILGGIKYAGRTVIGFFNGDKPKQ